MKKAFAGLLAALELVFAASAGAAVITYHMTVPNASGSNNGVPFTNQTVSITIKADTSQVTPVAGIGGSPDPGNCVPALSTSISVSGGTTSQAIAPVFFCSTLDAFIAGIFTTSNAAPGTWYFIADYSNAGITDFALASSFPPTTNVPGDTAETASPLALAGGGTATLTTVPGAGTTFSANLGGAGAAPAPVPTLQGSVLLVLAALVALGGMASFRRSRRS